MIAPKWCEFNANPLVNDRTVLCFRVPEVKDREKVQEELSRLQPELLLFLRQLRCINVIIQSPSGELQESYCLDRSDEGLRGSRITSLTRQDFQPKPRCQTDKFLVCQHTRRNMPGEERRPNVSESDVVIAFPLTDGNEPKVRKCDTFNFLPIADYGLPVRRA